MENLSNAIQSIKDLAEKACAVNSPVYEVGDRKFFSLSNQEIFDEKFPKVLEMYNLSSIIDYLKFSGEKINEMIVHVVSPESIFVYGKVDKIIGRRIVIECIIDRKCKIFEFDRFLEPENFVIGLHSLFQKNDDLLKAIQKASVLKIEKGVESNDSGGAFNVSAKHSVKSGSELFVFNLRPYRTFREIDQPESSFIFRTDKNLNCALFSADGESWRIAAVSKLKQYLKENLKNVVVI